MSTHSILFCGELIKKKSIFWLKKKCLMISGHYVFKKRCLFYREAMEEGEIEEEETKKKVPLSLEELLAKKKAEEEALAKVCVRTIYIYTTFLLNIF